MPAGATYEPIATFTVTSNTTSITFSSIPSGYTDLVVAGRWLSPGSSLKLRLNGDSSSNYYQLQLSVSGFTVSSSNNVRAHFEGGEQATEAGLSAFVWNIQDYAVTNKYKSILYTNTSLPTQTVIRAGSYWSTSAITSITLFIDTSNITFGAGTNMTIYGIAAA